MPNFATHWLVADMCIGRWGGIIPQYIKDGRDAYTRAVKKMMDDLTEALGKIGAGQETYESFTREGFAQIIWDFDQALKGINKNKEGTYDPQDMAVYDDITCFSAYMLGACGPDFWTLPSSGNALLLEKSMASHHFDLGHYNRTHMVFKHFVHKLVTDRVKFPYDAGNKPGLQARAAISCFMGMATHFAADLVIHQLVNVSAGAYGLLEGRWDNEHGPLLDRLVCPWNTHNKVEHYWDVYLRYRIFSNHGPLWEGRDGEMWEGFKTLGFPVAEKMAELAGQSEFLKNNPHLPRSLDSFFREEAIRVQLEKCHNLPRVFCDRMLEAQGGLTHFLYDIIVDKKGGAYPGRIIYDEAFDEAVESQFDDAAAPKRIDRKGKETAVGKSEKQKIEYFSSKSNVTAARYNSLNYLNYNTMPGLERVRRFGWQMFYDLKALPRFINAAVDTAGKFVDALSRAIDHAGQNIEAVRDEGPDAVRLGALGGFWNLDCGTGVTILKDEDSLTTREANTLLDFAHVLDTVNRKAIGHKIDYTHADSPEKGTKAPVKYRKRPPERPVFNVYAGREFESIIKVREEKDGYLEKIRVQNPVESHSCIPVPTRGQNDNKCVVLVGAPMWNRVNLTIRSSMADLQSSGEDGFFFLGDNHKVKSATVFDTLEKYRKNKSLLRDWLQDHAGYYDFYSSRVNERNGVTACCGGNGVHSFSTHFLITVEDLDAPENRQQKKDIARQNVWANDVPYDKFKNHYGWNFVVGTGRKNVLQPVTKQEEGLEVKFLGRFDASEHFNRYMDDITPTEYVPFSLRLLVERKDRMHYLDIISKNIFRKDQFKEMMKIDWAGFVKIVLVYEYVTGRDQGIRLQKYCIDGCEVAVTPSGMRKLSPQGKDRE